jgi:hypothetical protein
MGFMQSRDSVKKFTSQIRGIRKEMEPPAATVVETVTETQTVTETPEVETVTETVTPSPSKDRRYRPSVDDQYSPDKDDIAKTRGAQADAELGTAGIEQNAPDLDLDL